jgi:hypothetical protein
MDRNYSDEFAKSGGYEAHVTGFAAIFANLFKAFGGIDSTLLKFGRSELSLRF